MHFLQLSTSFSKLPSEKSHTVHSDELGAEDSFRKLGKGGRQSISKNDIWSS